MNWDQIQGIWSQFTAKVKETWTHFTDDELDQIAGQRERLWGNSPEEDPQTAERAEHPVHESLELEELHREW